MTVSSFTSLFPMCCVSVTTTVRISRLSVFQPLSLWMRSTNGRGTKSNLCLVHISSFYISRIWTLLSKDYSFGNRMWKKIITVRKPIKLITMWETRQIEIQESPGNFMGWWTGNWPLTKSLFISGSRILKPETILTKVLFLCSWLV